MEAQNERINDLIINNANVARGQNRLRKKRAAMAHFRPKFKKFPKDAFEVTAAIGFTHSVDVFTPGNFPRSTDMVTGMSWTAAASADEKYQATAMFASALSAFSPSISRSVVSCLVDKRVKVNPIDTPEEADEHGYEARSYVDTFTYEEALLSFGISLLLPFKQITDKNFDKFIVSRKKALGAAIGLMDEEITAYKYPLDLRHAKMVKSVLSGNKGLKQEILNFIMWASELPGSMGALATYASTILAWNEMNLIVFINNVFVNSKSPVMNHPMVQYEVNNFKRAMIHITRSACPHFFKYFCSPEEEHMIQRHNFPILGAVAQELLNKKSSSDSMMNFAGTAEKGSELATHLAGLHTEFCDTSAVSSKSKTLEFIFEDGDYEELLIQEEEEY